METQEKPVAANTDEVKPCITKVLPPDLLIPSSNQAIEINARNADSANRMLEVTEGGISPEELALMTAKRWPESGVILTVGFLDNPPANLRTRILSHMNAWNQFANVRFVETSQNPQVRISRASGADGGYWSYLGTDILSIPANEPTMNLEGFTMNTSEAEFVRVVRHETGHTLGFLHEHKRVELVNRIDREKAIAYFMRTQGWTREEVIEQVLTPLNKSALIQTAQADPNSIMCYWLPAEVMKDGIAVPGGPDIDFQDAAFAGSVYPKPGQTSKAAPSLAAFNNRLWVAFVANNGTNSVLVCSSVNGVSWTANTPINQASKSAPALAVFNNRLWIAFVANNGTNSVLVCSTADGQTWTNNTPVNQAAKDGSAPSLAVFNNRLWLSFVANNNTNSVLVCSSANGQNWTNNTPINQAARGNTSPSLTVFNNRLWLAFVANNSTNNVLVCSSADGQNWTNNTPINQTAKDGTSPSLAVFSNRLWISFIANNNTNSVLVCSSANGQNWTNNTPINQASKNAPTLAVFNNRLFVSFIANNSTNSLLLCSSTDGQNWTNNIRI